MKGIPDFPNPDKSEQIATKAPRHKAKPLVDIHLCVFVSWWRKCFAIKCKEFTTKTLERLSELRSDSSGFLNLFWVINNL